MKLVSNISKETELNIAKLEHAIIIHFRPSFLYIAPPAEGGVIEIILSCQKFNYQNVQERISEFFNLINLKLPGIVEEQLLVVQCYNSSEMEQVLMEVFK
jgi:hypothetical protein